MRAVKSLSDAKEVRLLAESEDPMVTRSTVSECSAATLSAYDRPLISVVMTCYNSEDYIEAALQSLLEQSYSDLDIVVVDDRSADSTREKVSALAGLDRRIRLLPLGENRGTYWAKNAGILLTRGRLVTFMDSDDVAHPLRIQRQYEAVCPAGVVASTTRYVRVFADGSVRESKRHGLITLMVRREVFDQIGYFDSVRTSADEEFFRRVKLAFGQRAVANVSEPLYIARVRADSLSMDPANPAISEETGSLGPVRMHYFKSFSAWHDCVFERKRVPFFEFPLYRRPFDVDPMLLPTKGGSRRDSLSVIIDSRQGVSVGGAELLKGARQWADQVVLLCDGSASPQHDGEFRVSDVGVRRVDSLDGVRVPRGRVAVLDASYHYSAEFLRQLLFWGEFAPFGAVVGCRQQRSSHKLLNRYMSEVDSLLLGALTFHTDTAAEEEGDERTLRLALLASRPFLNIESLSEQITLPAGSAALRLDSKRVSVQEPTSQLTHNSPADEAKRTITPTSNASVESQRSSSSFTSPTNLGAPLGTSRKAGGIAKAVMLFEECQKLLRLLLLPWSGIELGLMGGAIFAALALFAGFMSVVGTLAAAAVAFCMLFTGLALVFVGRRVRVSVTGSAGMNPQEAVRAQFRRIRRIFRSDAGSVTSGSPVVTAHRSPVHRDQAGMTSRILRQFGGGAVVALRQGNYQEALGLWTDAVRFSRVSSSERDIVELLGAAFAAAAGQQLRARMLALGAASAVRRDKDLGSLYSLLVGPAQPEPCEVAGSVASLS